MATLLIPTTYLGDGMINEIAVVGRQMRQTSIEAYNKIRESGTINRLQMRVLEYVANNPGRTASECAETLGCGIQSISGRYTELENKGLIRGAGFKMIGNHTHTTWEMTGNTIPIPRCNKKNSENMALRAKVEYYRNLLQNLLNNGSLDMIDRVKVVEALEK
jgi:hypothetical protein